MRLNRLLPQGITGLALLIVAYLGLALTTSLVVPLGESPDEIDHFAYVRFLVREGQFPVMNPDPDKNETMEANQPPLYYLAGAALTSWLPLAQPVDPPQNRCFSNALDDPGRQTFYLHDQGEAFPYQDTSLAFHLVRGLSVLFGATTIVLAYILGRLLSRGKHEVGLIAAGLLAFNPQFIFITASVNNDVLTALLGGAIVAVSIVTLDRPDWKSGIALGLLVGLGLLTKFALFALWPVAILATAWPALKLLSERRSVNVNGWGPVLAVVGLPMLVAGWWYWRALQLYDDPLAWAVHLQAKGQYVMRSSPFTWSDLVEFARLHFQSYWALFGWLNVALPAWLYLIPLVITVVGLAGLAWAIFDRLRQNPAQTSPMSEANIPGIVVALLSIAAIYLSLLRYIQTINWSGYQGRLAYAVIAPLSALLALGWNEVGRRLTAARGGVFAGAVRYVPVVMLGLLATGSLLFVLLPVYPRPTIYQTPAAVSQICVRFRDGLMLEGYSSGGVVRPDQLTPVTLYGYGLADSPEPVQLVGQLVGPDDQVIGQARTSLNWQAGQVVSSTLLLPVEAYSEPVQAVLQVGLLEPNATWQPASSATGRMLDIPFSLQTVKIASAIPFRPTPQHPAWANFGEQMGLLGYDLAIQGQTISVTLYWQALAPMTSDFTTFIHLLDEAGHLVSQADGQPRAGTYPTSIWDEGEIVADPKSLALPTDLSADPFTLWIGVYSLPSLERLPLTSSESSADTFQLLSCPGLESCPAGPNNGSQE